MSSLEWLLFVSSRQIETTLSGNIGSKPKYVEFFQWTGSGLETWESSTPTWCMGFGIIVAGVLVGPGVVGRSFEYSKLYAFG